MSERYDAYECAFLIAIHGKHLIALLELTVLHTCTYISAIQFLYIKQDSDTTISYHYCFYNVYWGDLGP